MSLTFLLLVGFACAARIQPDNYEELQAQLAECEKETQADECTSVHYDQSDGTSCVTTIDLECMVKRIGDRKCAEHVERLNDACVTLLRYNAEDNTCLVHTDMACRNGVGGLTVLRQSFAAWAMLVERFFTGGASSAAVQE